MYDVMNGLIDDMFGGTFGFDLLDRSTWASMKARSERLTDNPYDKEGGHDLGAWSDTRIVDLPDSVRIHLTLSGCKREDLKMILCNSHLVVTGSSKVLDRKYKYPIKLAPEVTRDDIISSYVDGLLTITLKKRKPDEDQPGEDIPIG